METRISCPALPSVENWHETYMNRCLSNMKALFADSSFQIPSFKRIVSNLPPVTAQKVFSDLLLHILKQNINKYKWDPNDKRHFLVILKECPSSAEVEDERGYLPIHFLLETDVADLEVIYHLIMASPKSLASVAPSVYGAYNCLQMALVRGDADYKLVLLILSLCPELARVSTSAGKYPLHLALADITNGYHSSDEFFHRIIKKILTLFPAAMTMEVTDELRFMRLRVGEQGELHGSDDAGAVSNVHNMQVKTIKWSPIERVRNSHDTELKTIFERFVEALTWKRLQSQWKI